MEGEVEGERFLVQKREGEWKWTGYVRIFGKLEKHNLDIDDMVVRDGKIIGKGKEFEINGTCDEETKKITFI